MLCCTISFAQQNPSTDYQASVDIVPVPVQINQLDESRKDYNPNGVKLYFDRDPNFVNLKFKWIVSELLIEVINNRGKVINKYSGKKIGKVKINIARLKRGNYYVRLSSREINDFLKITKD